MQASKELLSPGKHPITQTGVPNTTGTDLALPRIQPEISSQASEQKPVNRNLSDNDTVRASLTAGLLSFKV